jgi:hypothetical protein
LPKFDPSLDGERRHPADQGSIDMPVIALKVTKPPSAAADHRMPQSTSPLFRGNGDADYVCGNCAAVIAAGMGPTQHFMIDTTICAGCGAENEFPRELRA